MRVKEVNGTSDIILRPPEFALVTESLQFNGYLRQIRNGLRACRIQSELPFYSCRYGMRTEAGSVLAG